MNQRLHVHVVDSDCARRAAIARELYCRSIHVEIYEDLEELISRAPAQGPVLVHADQRSLDERQCIEAIRARTDYLPVAFYAAEPQTEKVVEAMRSGAIDYMRWPAPLEALKGSVRRVARVGEGEARSATRRTVARRSVEALSKRERDVLVGIAGGDSNKEIARRLGISHRTVEIHRGNMMARLKARSTGEALRIGLSSGLID